jgi:hypothetical protein
VSAATVNAEIETNEMTATKTVSENITFFCSGTAGDTTSNWQCPPLIISEKEHDKRKNKATP